MNNKSSRNITYSLLGIGIIGGIAVGGWMCKGIKDEIVPQSKIQEKIVYRDQINSEAIDKFISIANKKIYGRMSSEILKYSKEMSEKYKLSHPLVLSIMKKESEFNPFAVSSAGAAGLMQINLPVWREDLIKNKIIIKDSDIFDPKNNIEAGCFILRSCIDRTKSIKLALCQYLGSPCDSYPKDIETNIGELTMYNVEKESIQ
jgi:soluble lytic murein transglycosylase-like protein